MWGRLTLDGRDAQEERDGGDGKNAHRGHRRGFTREVRQAGAFAIREAARTRDPHGRMMFFVDLCDEHWDDARPSLGR